MDLNNRMLLKVTLYYNEEEEAYDEQACPAECPNFMRVADHPRIDADSGERGLARPSAGVED